MVIFVAKHYVYNDDHGEYIGMFSTEEKAKEAIRRFENEIIERCGYIRNEEESIYYQIDVDKRQIYCSNETEDMSS